MSSDLSQQNDRSCLTLDLAGALSRQRMGVVIVAVSAFFSKIIRLQEDRTLQEELEGYEDYAQQVSYRLSPGVWR